MTSMQNRSSRKQNIAVENLHLKNIDCFAHPVLLLDQNLKILSCNRHYLDFAKQELSESDLGTNLDFLKVHPDGSNRILLEKIRTVIGEKESSVFEDYSSLHARWIEYHISPTPTGAMLLIFDIDEKKRQELKLKNREQTLRMSLEKSAGGIACLGLDGRWLSLNEQVMAITGINRESMSKHSFKSICLPDDVLKDRECFVELISGKRNHFISERQIYRQDGSLSWVLIKVSLVSDENKSPKFFIINMDCIDERKEAEESLKFALDAAAMGNWDYDAIHDETRGSREFYRIYGLHKAPPHWSYADFIKAAHPEDRETFETNFHKALSLGRNFILEFRIVWPDASVRWISLRGRVYLNNHGKAVRMAGVIMDFTREKIIAQDLQSAKLAAEDANREKSYFLANMSHEIRTPLGAMLGFTDLLAENNLSREERLKYVQIIARNGRNLSALIDDILDLSKVEAGHLEVEKIRVNVWELLESVCTLLKVKADAKGLKLLVRAENLIPGQIMTDSIRIRQILLNIIGNAIKFTNSGTISVALRYSSATDKEGSTLKFEISDTGVGISASAAQKLFNPFMQADSSTTRNFGGTGLGLALSRRIARAMGGDLILEKSSAEKGSTFSIQIPAMLAPQELTSKTTTPTKAAQLSEESLSGLRILIADDSTDNQFLLKRMLNKRGADIELADDGCDAVEKAMHSDFDLVLMDMQMPKLDGYEATKELRNHGYNTPIVALTANAMKHDRDKCLAAGCSDYLAKPVNSARLFQIVNELVHNRRH